MASNFGLERVSVNALKPAPRNVRTHSKKQIAKIASSIEAFGFNNPILIDGGNMILAGHGRVLAAKSLKMKDVPVLRISHLTPEQTRAYILADNRIAQEAGYDTELLALELQELADLAFELGLTGFDETEIDKIIAAGLDADPSGKDASPDDLSGVQGPAVTQRGDVWLLGRHRLLCGDAREAGDVDRLLDGERADMVFTDPPYNVAIEGNVSGLGKRKHGDFAMACGEMSPAEFTAFLSTTLGNAARACRDGAIAYVFMDWRHMREVLDAGAAAFTELKNMCVWGKTNAGMGSFYRSQHELVFVFKIGEAPHLNTFGLGGGGRHRSNLWSYRGATVGGAERDELETHATPKPVALVQDAIKDVSKRNHIVLDLFGGSGTTLIAAEQCGRRARLIEYDPAFCDVIVRRYEKLTGKKARLGTAEGPTFEDVGMERAGAACAP